MNLNGSALHAVGNFLDQQNVPEEDRRILCVIDGVDYRFDAGGCWRFVSDKKEIGWAQCNPPDALQGLF